MSYSGTLATTELIGNLGNDPEIKETNNGKKYAVLSIATKIKTGANDEETLWHRVVVWNESTIDKYIIPYIKKVLSYTSKEILSTIRWTQMMVKQLRCIVLNFHLVERL